MPERLPWAKSRTEGFEPSFTVEGAATACAGAAVTAESTSAVRPRNRRQLIVDAAGRVFSQRGYHAASMEEIAAGVDITAAALYRHFPNKYALFAECANVMVDRLVAALRDNRDLLA